MNKQEVDALKEALKAEYEKDMAAIERVEKMLGRRGNPGIPIEPSREPQESDSETTLIDRVKEMFVRSPEKRWTVGALEDQMRADGFHFDAVKPRSSIHTCLTRLEERSMVRIVKRGRGRKPSIYQYQPPPQDSGPSATVVIGALPLNNGSH